MKAGWQIASIGEVCAVVNGGTPKSNVASYWDGEINWLTPKDMGKMAGRTIGETPRKITEQGLADSSARLVPPKSVILSTRAPIGHLAINEVPMAFNQGCRGLVPQSSLHPLYLYHFLSASIEALNDLGTGATFKELSASALKAFVIPLPPLEEQKRIVAVLDKAFEGLDHARANAEANLADSREFAGIGASHVLSVPARIATVGELVADGILFPPIDGNHGEIHPKKADFVPSGVPFIMASDLVNGEVDQSGCCFISEKQAKSLRKGFAEDGDVLVSHKGTIGRVALLKTAHEYAVLTPQVTYYRVRDLQRLERTYLYHVLRSREFQDQLLDGAKDGATRAYIGITKQLNLKIALPDIEDQRRIVSVAAKMEKFSGLVMNNYNGKIAELAAVRQSLLQRAFSGELT